MIGDIYDTSIYSSCAYRRLVPQSGTGAARVAAEVSERTGRRRGCSGVAGGGTGRPTLRKVCERRGMVAWSAGRDTLRHGALLLNTFVAATAVLVAVAAAADGEVYEACRVYWLGVEAAVTASILSIASLIACLVDGLNG